MSRLVSMIAVVVLWLAGARSACAQTARDLIAQGTEHYQAERYALALKSYEQAAAASPQPSPELLHDLAAAHFKLGDFQAARDLWVRAKQAGDAALEARTRYNLGNCDYAEALHAAQQNPQLAMQRLDEAAAQYRSALQLDPQLTDARANLELAQVLKRQIEEQMQNQPQSQPSTNQAQQQQERQEQQQPSSQPSQSPQSQPSQTQPATQPSQTEQQEKSQEHQESQEQQGQEQEQSAEEEQTPPPETMPAETQPAEEQEGREQAVPVQLTREQAERLLQMIRDAEKLRREKLAQQRMAKQKPVERDW